MDSLNLRFRYVLAFLIGAVITAAVLRHTVHTYGGISREDIRADALMAIPAVALAIIFFRRRRQRRARPQGGVRPTAPGWSAGDADGGKAVNFYLNARKVAGRGIPHWPESPYQVREFCRSYVPGAPIASPGDSHGSGESFPGRERQPRHRKSENQDSSGS
jgi:hypothetical protein